MIEGLRIRISRFMVIVSEGVFLKMGSHWDKS